MIKEKIIPYRESHECKVIFSSQSIVAVKGLDNGEGYLLLGHGLDPLPKEGDVGTIIFLRDDGPNKGHWQYYPNNNTGYTGDYQAAIQSAAHNKEYIPMQKCPLCDGEGVVKKNLGTVTEEKFYKECPVCEGKLIIPMHEKES